MGEVIAIIAVSCFGTCFIILSMCVGFAMIRKAGPGKKSTDELNDETRLIQEIHHGLTRMEDRVEALETLLLDTDRKKKSDFDTELNRS